LLYAQSRRQTQSFGYGKFIAPLDLRRADHTDGFADLVHCCGVPAAVTTTVSLTPATLSVTSVLLFSLARAITLKARAKPVVFNGQDEFTVSQTGETIVAALVSRRLPTRIVGARKRVTVALLCCALLVGYFPAQVRRDCAATN
jgi:hypothetical protein